MRNKIRSTTILVVRRNGKVVMAGDGQVTLGHEVLKASARKLRRLYNDKILAGFAGSTADAFALFARFEAKLEQYNGNLPRIGGRTGQGLAHGPGAAAPGSAAAGGRYGNTYLVSGNGDVIEPDEEVAAIGSGGPFAKAAATALLREHQAGRARDRRKGDEHRRQDLHLHQRERHLRGAGLTWSFTFPASRWTKSRCSTN